MAIPHLPTKTKTSIVQRRTLLRVSARFAQPSVRLIQPQRDASKRLRQLQKSERIQQLQSSERQKQHKSDTTAEASSEPATTTSKPTTEIELTRSAHTKKQNRVVIRLPPSHVRDAMQFIPIEDILDNLIAKNLGKIPNGEDIATAATYYFMDLCSTVILAPKTPV